MTGSWCLAALALAAAWQAKILADGPLGRGLALSTGLPASEDESTGLLTSVVLGPSRSCMVSLGPSRSRMPTVWLGGWLEGRDGGVSDSSLVNNSPNSGRRV